MIGISLVFSSGAAVAGSDSADPVDPLACTEEEILAVMSEYEASLGSIDKYHVPRFEKFREVRMAHRAQDPETREQNLCDVIANTEFKIPDIDLSMLEAGWSSLKALMAGNTNGVDWSTVMSEAYKAGMKKAKKWWLENNCKLAQNFSQSVNESIDEAHEEAKDTAKGEIENTEEAKQLGASDLDKPLYRQVAEKQTEDQLEDYAGYAKWYDEDQWGEGNRQDAMDNIVDKVLGDQRGNALDKHVDDVGSERLGSILDKVEPKY
ncbi:hypothetical protein [Photobacterium galatheae]|uniref:Uncharacterized protein n=1 Tax=Photobacterium galatheae TaxID=1654360 RepID=A0A066RU36_9GAMM|nr:hypothetical protein [Photobacterium galatheae]KDM90903.1 hypothetical protein EA58_14180 [Photobacterium galatheae]MCM0149133.1 hypothetical protein [Photobacterium galatheae]